LLTVRTDEYKTVGIRELTHDSWDRKAETGQPARDGRNRTAGPEQPERRVGIVHPGQEREERRART
jgi:hypothetical protein